MADKIKFKIKTDKFSDFLDKLEDLTKIGDSVKLKIDNQNILIYSIMGGNVMLAFKNYTLNTSDIFDGDFDYTIDCVLVNCKKLVKNLQFIKTHESPTLEIGYKVSPDDDTIMNARSLQFVGGKLKVNWIAGEHYEVRDINKNTLKQRLDIKNRKWSFKISDSDFSDIKKLSSINSNSIISISVVKGTVFLSETSAWEMEIDKIDDRNSSLMLNKKFLNCINDNGTGVEFHIFDTFMLIKDDISNLMLSFEQNFADED